MKYTKTILVVLSAVVLFFSYSTSIFAYNLTNIDVANDPRFMAVIGTKIYISHYFSGTVSILDTTDNSVTTLGIPNAWAITTLGNKVYVAKSGNDKVAIIDTSDDNSIVEVDIDGNPGEFAVANGNVYVANGGDNSISIINGSTDAVEDIDVGITAEHIAVIGDVVYVTGGAQPQVTAIDTGNGNDIEAITVGSLPNSIIAVGTKLYVTNRGSDTVSIINTVTGNSVATVAVGHFVTKSIALGSKIYALNSTSVGFGSNSVSIIDGSTDTLVATVPSTNTGNSNSTATAAILGTKIFIAYVNGSVSVFNTSDNSFENLVIGNDPYSIITVGTKVYVTRRTADLVTIIGRTYTLDYSANENGTISGSASQTVNESASGSTVTAVPDENYAFENWSDGSRQNPRTDTNVTGDVAVSATFYERGSNGPLFTGTAADYFGYIPPRMQIIYPDGHVVYLDTPNQNPLQATTTRATLNITKQLSLGSKNSEVLRLQKYLNTHGYTLTTHGPGSPGNETSLYGRATRNAVIRFQKDNNIRPTGIVGPLTRAALNSKTSF